LQSFIAPLWVALALLPLDSGAEFERFVALRLVAGGSALGCNIHHQGSYASAVTCAFSARIAVLMRKPWVIAHRGASGHAPENTLAAFERAVQLGAGFIETDLHLTRDARFVAIHDATLERTTNGRGNVHDFTLAELRHLDAGMWFDREFMGQRIPTLEEILKFGQDHDVIFYLEVKYDAAWGMHHSLVAELHKSQSTARSIVISFDESTLTALRTVDSTMMMGLLVDRPREDFAKVAIELGVRQLCPRANLVTPKLVEEAHRVDLQVATWTADDPEVMRAVAAAGVDGIMSNFPDRLQTVLEDVL
jgi:glycerophosphoryl diester phosphodiesterase